MDTTILARNQIGNWFISTVRVEGRIYDPQHDYYNLYYYESLIRNKDRSILVVSTNWQLIHHNNEVEAMKWHNFVVKELLGDEAGSIEEILKGADQCKSSFETTRSDES